MEKTWEWPQKNFIKINTHAVTYPHPLPSGNTTGLGVVLRDHKGAVILMVSGTIPGITERANELWALIIGLRCAFYEEEENVEIKTDNAEAVKEWMDWNWFIEPNHSGVIKQLLQRSSDPNLNMKKVKVISASQNKLARYLAEEGAQSRTRLVALRRPLGMVREIWRLDMGLGPLDGRFMVLTEEEYEEIQAVEVDIQHVQEMLDLLVQEAGEGGEEDAAGEGVHDGAVVLEIADVQLGGDAELSEEDGAVW